MKRPAQYLWLWDETGPRILKEFLSVFGVEEDRSDKSNPAIIDWAKSIGYEKIYKDDKIPWCGLAMAYVAGQAGWEYSPQGNPLWALNWAHWGDPADRASLGDVLVFKRPGGGHVGLYVGEDDDAFHVLGGNTQDKVDIARIERNRLVAARRCRWRINQPNNVRVVKLGKKGQLSTNEA